MPASFAASLCGYRDGNPSVSDASQSLSVEIGHALFERLGVSVNTPAVRSVDRAWSAAMVADLGGALSGVAPHLSVGREVALHVFEQYAHLKAAKDLADDEAPEVGRSLSALEAAITSLTLAGLERLQELVADVRSTIEQVDARRRALLDLVGDESLLKLDIAVERGLGGPGLRHLVAGFSLKWSLRTDRLQDPKTQGTRISALRRGRMPHFATVTMEPRPYMLGLLGRGTGDLDCIYHLDLAALSDAVEAVYSTKSRLKQRDTFRRLVDQRRLRDYDELVGYLATL